MSEFDTIRDYLACPHRARLRVEDGWEWADCRLVQEMGGEVISRGHPGARSDACNFCCQWPVPTPKRVNPMIASLLFNMVDETKRAGSLGVDYHLLSELEAIAIDNMQVVNLDGSSVETRGQSVPAFSGPCYHLGEQLGERTCVSCRGNVQLKVFSCQHDLHEDTTIRECQRCPDYDPEPPKGAVSKWAVAVTTAPREQVTLGQTLQSLASAGWGSGTIFAEPEAEIPAGLDGFEVVRRRQTMGAWGNFYLALTELYLSDPHADAYFMCQDDVIYQAGLRKYLEAELWPGSRVGVVSLHTPSHQREQGRRGFYAKEVGWGAWGAMGFVFSNPAARSLLRDGRVLDHRQRGNRGGMFNVDSVVGEWCLRTRRDYFLHAPSLSQHIGASSTLWEKADLSGRRVADDFVEDLDIAEVMSERGEVPSSSGEHAIPEAQGGSAVPVHVPRPAGIVAFVLGGEAAGYIDSQTVRDLDAQELPADEHFWLAGDQPDDLEGDWRLAALPDGSLRGIISASLQASAGAWFVYLPQGCRLSPSFISSLNERFVRADRYLGMLVLAPSPKGAGDDGAVEPAEPESIPHWEAIVLRREACAAAVGHLGDEHGLAPAELARAVTSDGWGAGILRLRSLPGSGTG